MKVIHKDTQIQMNIFQFFREGRQAQLLKLEHTH